MNTTTKPIIDANDLEAMAKQRPQDKFLKGSGVLKLIQAIRDLERANRQLQAQPKTLPVAQTPPPMPEHWHVVVGVNCDNILCIGSGYLHGKRELSEAEENTIIGAAQHLLAFVGHGLPPSSFDPDSDDAPTAPAPAAPPGYVQGVESVAKMIEKKADDFAKQFGSDDMGSLSFGRGAHADAKLDYHSSLVELADEARAMLAAAPQPPEAAQEPVHGDLLPPVGSRVFIRHGRDDDAHACTVTGYYAWGHLRGDKRLHRVFVRLVYEGTTTEQSRMLCDCYPTAAAALAADAPPSAQPAVTTGAADALPDEKTCVDYVLQYGGRCRDCADENGVCPGSGLPCGGARKAATHVVQALRYGLQQGYLRADQRGGV